MLSPIHPSISRVDGWKMVEVIFLQFSLYSSPTSVVFAGKVSSRNFWWDPPKQGHQTRVGNLFYGCMRDIQYVTFSFARGSSHSATWCLHVILHLLCWINLISEDATLFCNKWHSRQNFCCCCVVFGFCFKLNFCHYMWHRFEARQILYTTLTRHG